jgi:hypothetical protein
LTVDLPKLLEKDFGPALSVFWDEETMPVTEMDWYRETKGKGDDVSDWLFCRDVLFKQIFVEPLHGGFEIVYHIAPDIVGTFYLYRRAVTCFSVKAHAGAFDDSFQKCLRFLGGVADAFFGRRGKSTD